MSGNIAAHLTERARRAPRQVAVTESLGPRPAAWTYAELDARSTALARGLVGAGLAPGARVAVMVPPSLPFFAVTFALFKAGLVPVFIDPGMGLKPLKRCLDEAAPHAFVGVWKAQLARRLFGWGKGHLRRSFQVGGLPLFGAAKLDRLAPGARALPERLADDTAAILFTSGSTGAPKGAVYRHATFAAQLAALQALLAIADGEVDLCTFPLFALFAPALGMTSVVPAMDFTRPAAADPGRLIAAIERFGVTNVFGSPALLRTLARFAVPRGVRLGTVRRLVSAGAPVGPKLVAEATRLLAPGVELMTPYGATEALPVAAVGSREILGETGAGAAAGRGVCVGRAAPGITLSVMPIDDGPVPVWDERLALPPGRIGEVVVKGPQVTTAYFGRPEADHLAKMKDGDGVRHRMGDLGYLDAGQRLWLCGRKSQRVETATGELYTDPCEGIFNVVPGVHRTALVGRGARGGMTPVLCVEPERRLGPAGRRALERELLAAARERAPAVREVRFFKTLPVDTRHNSKIFRERLKAAVDREASP